MARATTTPREVPDRLVGGQWDKSSHQPPTIEQTAFSWDRQARLEADQVQLRALFAAMVRTAGGVDWLAKALNEKPGYASKITDAINGAKKRRIQLNWFPPLLEDPRAAEILLGWLSERCHYSPPVRARQVTSEEEAAAAREVIAELEPELSELMRRRVAKKLGVRFEDLKR